MALATQSKRANVELEAAFVNFGTPECRKVTFVDDVALSLEDEYWEFNTTDFDGVETEYEVVLDGGSGTHTVTPGKTLITVTYTSGDSASTIAGLFKTALDAIDGIKSVDNGDGSANYENWYSGAVTAEDNANAPSLTFAQLLVGDGGNLGASEAIEVSFGTETVELTANQFGATIIGESFAGNSIEITTAFFEVDASLREQLLSSTGATEDLGGGKKFSGGGEGKLFQNLDDSSKRMIIHPIRNASDNRDDDFVVWRAVFKPDSYNFDGENQRALSGMFSGFLDASKKDSINLYGFGDWTDSDLDK